MYIFHIPSWFFLEIPPGSVFSLGPFAEQSYVPSGYWGVGRCIQQLLFFSMLLIPWSRSIHSVHCSFLLIIWRGLLFVFVVFILCCIRFSGDFSTPCLLFLLVFIVLAHGYCDHFVHHYIVCYHFLVMVIIRVKRNGLLRMYWFSIDVLFEFPVFSYIVCATPALLSDIWMSQNRRQGGYANRHDIEIQLLLLDQWKCV